MAPEMFHGHSSEMSDVYAFATLMLGIFDEEPSIESFLGPELMGKINMVRGVGQLSTYFYFFTLINAIVRLFTLLRVSIAFL